uniref:Solute carrier family 29 member 2 n=1 Tax=Gopherus evgoodei TaxID=1825980 RepID=A0A8C4Y3K5_9SAUR
GRAGSQPGDSGFHAVGIIFFILGLGTLLPWNFFITAIPYFQARLIVGTSSTVGLEGNSSGTQQDPARDEFNFNNWLTLLSQLPQLLFTLLNSFLYQCIPDKVRVLGSMSGILLLFILTAGLVRVEMPPRSFFSITIISVWFINSFCAVLQGSLFGQLGILPQGYSTLFLSGQGMAGTFATSAMLLSMASGADAQTSALSYFITPCVGTLTSIVCYLVSGCWHSALSWFSLSPCPCSLPSLPPSPAPRRASNGVSIGSGVSWLEHGGLGAGTPGVNPWLWVVLWLLMPQAGLEQAPPRGESLMSFLHPCLLLPVVQHDGLAGPQHHLILPLAREETMATAPAGGPALPVCAPADAVPGRAPHPGGQGWGSVWGVLPMQSVLTAMPQGAARGRCAALLGAGWGVSRGCSPKTTVCCQGALCCTAGGGL